MSFIPVDHIEGGAAQAFTDQDNPGYGYVRFESAGAVHQFRLSLRSFEQLARDIQRAAKTEQPRAPLPSQANSQD